MSIKRAEAGKRRSAVTTVKCDSDRLAIAARNRDLRANHLSTSPLADTCPRAAAAETAFALTKLRGAVPILTKVKGHCAVA